MGYVVKRIKGRLYVYEQYRNERGKVVTRYLGPSTISWKARRSTSRNTSGMERPEAPLWWTGRDLNPGPLGCKPSALPG